ncbi:MAG: phosphoribosyltransferase family protein [Flavobacteriales bacterium]|jgi:pyrimidine operon attenuation protein/uracil phosphoribosyltransferase
MATERTLLLNDQQISRKITRIAHQIYEDHYQAKELVVVGVTGKGQLIAERIAALIKEISTLKVQVFELTLQKDSPLSSPIVFSGTPKDTKGKVVILVDDVLNSGRTLIYGAKYLLDAEPQSLSIATLVDRFHRRFPIRADYVGLTLSTNLKQHVSVEVAKGKLSAFLQ